MMYETLPEQPRRTQYSRYLLYIRWPYDPTACELLVPRHPSFSLFFQLILG